MEATQQAAQERLDYTLSTLRSGQPSTPTVRWVTRPAAGPGRGPSTPFHPDQIVIATLPPEYSVWHRASTSRTGRAAHGLPMTHVVATPVVTAARDDEITLDSTRAARMERPYTWLCR